MQKIRWSKDTIAYAAWLYWRRNDKWPTQTDWSWATEDSPSRMTVINHFGSWEAMLDHATDFGLDVVERTLRAAS